ncbi:MAG: hypothetical protein U0M92_03415 [Bacilli bacterium]
MNVNELKQKLINCQKISFDEVELDDLEDISKINFSKKQDSKEKILDFIKSAKNPYMFKCNGKKVKIAFANTDIIAEDSLIKNLNNIYK